MFDPPELESYISHAPGTRRDRRMREQPLLQRGHVLAAWQRVPV